MVWFVFGQTLTFDFVNFDDPQYVTENQLVLGGISKAGVIRALTHSDYSFYHPLTTLSHMLDFQIYNLNPAGFHFTNVVLHTLSSVLLFLIFRSMTGSLWRSALVAAVFAIHPLRAESVAWITERKDCLSGLFFMLTLAAYIFYVRRSFSIWRYGLVFLCMAACMLSKATVVTLPFVLLLLDFWPLGRFRRGGLNAEEGSDRTGPSRTVRLLVFEKIPFLILAVGMALVMFMSAREELYPVASGPMILRLANAVVSYVTYLAQSAFPVHLALLYPFPSEMFPWWLSEGAVLILGVVTLWVACKARHRPYLLIGWLWYTGMLVPLSGLVQAGGQAHADRYTYLSQIGLSLGLVWLLGSLATSRRRRLIASIFSVLVLAGFMATARVQAGYWADSVLLWNRSLALTKNNYVAHSNMGSALFVRGETETSIRHFLQSLQIASKHPEVWNNLAAAYAEEQRWTEAVLTAQRAVDLAEVQCPPEVVSDIRMRLAEYQGHLNSAGIDP